MKTNAVQKIEEFIRCSPGTLGKMVPLCTIISLLVCAPTGTAAGRGNPRVLPANSSPYGKTYGEWGAAWWQWALGIPEAENPVLDETGQFCDVDQSGPVWFLAGNFGGETTRECTVPAGKAIFMPVYSWIFGAGVFDCDPTVPGVECDVADLQEKAAAGTETATVLEVIVDGAQIQNVQQYRATSPEPFSVTFPEGALFGIPAGTHFPHVTDGYWLMLAPLRKGEHTLELYVESSLGGFFQLTYHLTVQ